MQKVLVTGGAGFIGSHLCERLLHENYEVICVDNYITGAKKNVSHLSGNPHFTLIEYDVIRPLPETISANFIFHHRYVLFFRAYALCKQSLITS